VRNRTAPELALEPASPAEDRVGRGFISLFTLAFVGTNLVFQAPLLVTLPLTVNSLVGIEQAPNSLALVAGVGAVLAILGNPYFGQMSDRTTSRLGMRRPWLNSRSSVQIRVSAPTHLHVQKPLGHTARIEGWWGGHRGPSRPVP
jgi:hypothetical protein